MSYNIDSVRVLKLDAWMKASDVHRLAKILELPERSFFRAAIESDADETGNIRLKSFDWYGEWSGHSYAEIKDTIAPFIHGTVEAVFCWEGGDSFTGLIINDGVVTECDVEFTLKPRKT